jgi:hypothetical protein
VYGDDATKSSEDLSRCVAACQDLDLRARKKMLELR